MDFLSNLAKGDQSKPSSDHPDNPENQDQKHSSSDLFGSAKVVASAAQAQFRNEPEKYDKTKAASAAADLLDAASEYGKLDETKGIGKYVDQAEGYLRQYNTGSQPASAGDASNDKPPAAPADDSSVDKPPATDAEKPSVGGGGAGDYIKMAEGFLNKPSGDDGEKSEAPSSGGGYEDVMKLAGGFLKK